MVVSAVGADHEETWKGESQDSSKTWLETDLLNQLPIARILFYDHGMLEQEDGLEELSHRLLESLEKREGAHYERGKVVAGNATLYDPPLVFVCHSTGGLVVEKALLNASDDKRSDRKLYLLKSCIGIVFFCKSS